jgi:hypothetical protein
MLTAEVFREEDILGVRQKLIVVRSRGVKQIFIRGGRRYIREEMCTVHCFKKLAR